MARGRINTERWVKHYVDRYVFLFALGSWRITWEVKDVVRNPKGESVEAMASVVFTSKKIELEFSRKKLRTKRMIEEAVIHEFAVHLNDRGARTRDAHILANGLVPMIRTMRIRATYAYD